MRIYLAGPLFTAAERTFNKALADALRARGHLVYLPQEAAGAEDDAAFIFNACVGGVQQSEVVLGNMDGPDPDSGTCFEVGCAFGYRRIALFRTDFRQAADHPDSPFNLMLSEAADIVFRLPLAGPDDIAAAFDQWAKGQQ